MAILPQIRCRVAVLGGGITGLAAMFRLQQAREAGVPVDEFLIETRLRSGGLILTERIQNFIVEGGPDSFLTEKPEALALAKELGLANELIGSNDVARRTYILHHGRLVPLPEGLTLFVPTRFRPAIFSPLVPLASKAAILQEVFFHPSRHPDESVAAFVRRHYGTGVLENIAEPLLAGIFGGDVERLSVQSTLPRIHALEQAYGSLARGIRKNSKKAGLHPPLFTSLREGMTQLVQALVSRLERSGSECRLKFGERAAEIQNRQPSSSRTARYVLRLERGAEYEVDAIISALPAPELARLVGEMHPRLALRLAQISYTPAVTVAMCYSNQKTPPGFGYLVPRAEKRYVRACTFVHAKFPGRVPSGAALLRCFMGNDPGVIQLEDEEIVSAVTRELQHDLGLTARPDFFRVYRWPAAMPQYHVGHEVLLREIRGEVERMPGMFLAGNIFSGVGISDCIRSATSAAEQALQFANEHRAPA